MGVTSLWLDRAQPLSSDPLPSEAVDDLVVGAGITGLVTALLLARAGRRVAVIEARTVGAAATGNTTAKISLLQGTRLSTVLGVQSRRAGEAYLEANREGQAWLLRFCEDHGVDVQRRTAFTYAADRSEVGTVREEYDAARTLGLGVRWQESLEVPFPSAGAVALDGQAQFDPVEALVALVEQLRAHGGTLHQGHRVTGVSWTGQPRANLRDGTELGADHVVLATGASILDRGLHFARVEAKRSYALAFDAADVPEGMFLSAGSDSRSVRDAPDGSRTRLLVGGSGHTVGRTRSEEEHVEALRAWTRTWFRDATETHRWSAQDYSPHDGLPSVGPLPGSGGRIHVATGFDKWGMTNGPAAAMAIAGHVLGSPPAWAAPLRSRVVGPRAAARLALGNAKVGVAAVGSAVEGLRRDRPCEVVGVCTHLGGVLHWNDAESTWDCPLHGSRFDAEGEVLEGPATKRLLRRSPSGE